MTNWKARGADPTEGFDGWWIVGPKGEVIGVVDGPQNHLARQAAMRLVKSAPELFEALEAWEEPNTCGCDTIECRGTCAPAKTRAALAKARGESQ